MRITRSIIGMGLAVSALAVSFHTDALADDKAALEARERNCAVAGATGGVEQAMECFSSSQELVAYDVFTPRESDGPQAARRYFRSYFASGYKNMKVDFISLHVATDGTIGYTNSIQHWTGLAPSGTPLDTNARVSDVWRKENGSWKIILTHSSFPVDPMTYKADLHSQP